MSNDRSTSANRVVIVGGGFAGVTLAQRLEGLALGDTALVPNAWDGKPSPPTAQFATRQAKQLADNLSDVLR